MYIWIYKAEDQSKFVSKMWLRACMWIYLVSGTPYSKSHAYFLEGDKKGQCMSSRKDAAVCIIQITFSPQYLHSSNR